MRSLRRTLLHAVMLGVASGLCGCSVHEHTVGLGPNELGSESHRQFYLFFGWLRLNDVDSQRLAADSTSYRITSEWSWIDALLSPLLLPLTVTTRTVTVER